eukprot:2745788-Rhodomonas_salina.1
MADAAQNLSPTAHSPPIAAATVLVSQLNDRCNGTAQNSEVGSQPVLHNAPAQEVIWRISQRGQPCRSCVANTKSRQNRLPRRPPQPLHSWWQRPRRLDLPRRHQLQPQHHSHRRRRSEAHHGKRRSIILSRRKGGEMRPAQLAISSGGKALAAGAVGGGAEGLPWPSSGAGRICQCNLTDHVNEDTLTSDFRRVSHLKVVLKWKGLPAGLKGLASLGTALTHLDLKNPKITDEGAELGADGAGRLAAMLAGCKSLSQIYLSFNRIGAEGARRLAEVLRECKTLAHLELIDNRIGTEGVGRLAEVLRECKALAHLGMSFNNLGDEGAGRLAEVLGECKALAHLEVRYTGIGAGGAGRLAGGNGISTEGAGRLAGVLGGCKALTHLQLSGTPIFYEGAGLLAGVLGECKVLAHLQLDGTGIGAKGAGLLAGVLKECKVLAHLDLSSNSIGAEGVGLLARVLGECKELAHLNLRYNGIGAEGAGLLAGCWHLHLSSNQIDENGARSLGVRGRIGVTPESELAYRRWWGLGLCACDRGMSSRSFRRYCVWLEFELLMGTLWAVLELLMNFSFRRRAIS